MLGGRLIRRPASEGTEFIMGILPTAPKVMVALRSPRAIERERAVRSVLQTGIRLSVVMSIACCVVTAFYIQSLKVEVVRTKKNHPVAGGIGIGGSGSGSGAVTLETVQKWEERNVKKSKGAKAFVAENCDLGSEEWWPKESWKRRTPAFVIAGAKKCGTTSLFTYLAQHPNIASPRVKELLTFIPGRFKFWTEEGNYDSKVMVEDAREFMYDIDYPNAVARIKEDSDALSFEATPDYILYSTYSMKAILCTMPWVKIIVLLRNPVDRLFSHYNFLKDPALGNRIIKMSFEQWIQMDIRNLKQHGILPPGNMTTEEYFGSKEEKEAWRKYQQHADGERYLSRSLYALQFEEWFDALRLIGRDPAHCVKIFREEDMKTDPQSIADGAFSWLGLENHTLERSGSKMVSHYSSVLTKETRRMVEQLLAPYNQRLYKLLGNEWDGIWDWTEEEDVEETHVQENPIATFKPIPTPKKLDAIQEAFVNEHCKLGENTSWWPVGEESWKRRTPIFLVIGAKKAGTSSIFTFLVQHPNLTRGRAKELHTFQPQNMVQWKNPQNMKGKVDVDLLRRQMYDTDYFPDKQKMNPFQYAFEATPDYLLYSSFSTQAILCAAPWTKFVVSLRNPVDRLFSHYNFIMDDSLMPASFIKIRKNVTFEQFFESDMEVLRNHGVISDDIPNDEFFQSNAEQEAWYNYQKVRFNTSDFPVVRSLYALQLEDWFSRLRAVGKNPETELLIVREEDMKNDANRELNRILKFLNLPSYTFNTSKSIMVTKYTSELKPETRLKLEAFFEPYNQRLYKLLNSTDWAGVL